MEREEHRVNTVGRGWGTGNQGACRRTPDCLAKFSPQTANSALEPSHLTVCNRFLQSSAASTVKKCDCSSHSRGLTRFRGAVLAKGSSRACS